MKANTVPLLAVFAICLALLGCNPAEQTTEQQETGSPAPANVTVVLASEVEWEQLNPARGADSPQAGTLWGDRTGPGPAGFLLKPVDGFRSPPHIHTVDYHGVVIRGEIHNDHPEADDDFLPSGSFWTQPGGGVHITAARGDTIAYIEVPDAFDVRPASEGVDGVDVVIKRASEIEWSSGDSSRPRFANLTTGTADEPYRILVEFPPGLDSSIVSYESLGAVVITGRPLYRDNGEKENAPRAMEPGTFFGSTGNAEHSLSCSSEEACVFYVRVSGTFEIGNMLFKNLPAVP